MPDKTIAFEFRISINTVGNLAANAYWKLDVHGAARRCTPTGTRTSLAEPASISAPSANASRRAARHRGKTERRSVPAGGEVGSIDLGACTANETG